MSLKSFVFVITRALFKKIQQNPHVLEDRSKGYCSAKFPSKCPSSADHKVSVRSCSLRSLAAVVSACLSLHALANIISCVTHQLKSYKIQQMVQNCVNIHNCQLPHHKFFRALTCTNVTIRCIIRYWKINT